MLLKNHQSYVLSLSACERIAWKKTHAWTWFQPILVQHSSNYWAIKLTGTEFPLMHTCGYMTHKNMKGHVFWSSCTPGTYRHFCNRLGESPHASLVHHFVHSVMSTQETLFDIFQPSTMKPSHTSSSGQKRKSNEDLQEILESKKCVFLPNGLKYLHG